MTIIESTTNHATRAARNVSLLPWVSANEASADVTATLSYGCLSVPWRMEVVDASEDEIGDEAPCWACNRDTVVGPQYIRLTDGDYTTEAWCPICIDCACSERDVLWLKLRERLNASADEITRDMEQLRADPHGHFTAENVCITLEDARRYASVLAYGFSITLAHARAIARIAMPDADYVSAVAAGRERKKERYNAAIRRHIDDLRRRVEALPAGARGEFAQELNSISQEIDTLAVQALKS